MFAAPHTLLWLHGSPIYLWLELSICNCFCKLYHLWRMNNVLVRKLKERSQAKPSQAKKKGINPTWLPVGVCTHTTKN